MGHSFLLDAPLKKYVFSQTFVYNETPKNEKWVTLFDGKTLKGWHTILGGDWKVEMVPL
jgi:hypothetical protein